MDRYFPDYKEVLSAHGRIKPFIHRTPVFTSRAINGLFENEFYFKCENFQKVGAFKFRGACNAVFSLSPGEVNKGVATHSSGNHAAALALAARLRNTSAYIVMPETAPEVKKKAVKGYGGEITWCEPTLQAREETLDTIVKETGAVFVHPYDNARIITGQATAAKELIEDAGNMDFLMAPVGGGGLFSGTLIAVKALSPKTRIIGVEPAGADDAYRSFVSGKLHPSINPKTIADGLLTSLSPMTFEIISDLADDIITVSEMAIVSAMKLIWERMKIIIEPSSAVPLAAFLDNKINTKNSKIGIVLSGGNVELNNLPF
jgi:threonine dehydratase